MIDQKWVNLGTPGAFGGILPTATHIYWTRGAVIGRALIDGSEPDPEWLTLGVVVEEEEEEPEGEARSICTDGTYLYWTWYEHSPTFPHNPRSYIGRCLLDGSELKPRWLALPTTKEATAVLVEGAHLYIGNKHDGRVGRVKLDGTELLEEWVTMPSGSAAGIFMIAYEGIIYCANNGHGNGSIDIAKEEGRLEGVNGSGGYAVHGDGRLYYTFGFAEPEVQLTRAILATLTESGVEGEATKPDCEGELELEGELGAEPILASDATHLYWSSAEGIGRCLWSDLCPEGEEEGGEGSTTGAGAHPFTYPAFDLLTLTPLEPLPYTGVSFGREVNAAGPWAGQLLLTDPRVQKTDYLRASATGRTALFVDWMGTLIWGGVIWTRRYRESQKTIVVGAQEFGSYFAQRLQAKDYATTWEGESATDPLVIATTVLEDAQNREPEPDVAPAKIVGGIHIIVNRHEEGAPPVSVSYPGTQLQTIDSIVSTLAQMGYKSGFDYTFDVAYLPGTRTPAVTLNFWYPRAGREADESGLVVLGSDCVDWTFDEDSTKQADLVFETGSGSGGVQPTFLSANPPGYPLLERAFSHSNVSDEAVLANIAIGDLAQNVYPVTTPALILPVPEPDARGRIRSSVLTFGGFLLGDDLTFRLDPVSEEGGLNQSPRFPRGLKFDWRISNWLCNVADQGLSTLTFNLGIPPVEAIPPPEPPLG